MTRHSELAEAYYALMKEDVFHALEVGVLDDIDVLPDVTAQAYEQHAADCLTLADRIDAEAFPDNTFEEQLEMEQASGWLRAVALMKTADVGGTARHAVIPHALCNFLEQSEVYLARDLRNPDQIIGGMISKLEQLPRYLKQESGRLDKPVEHWRDMELETARGFKTFTDAILDYAETNEYHSLATLKGKLDDANRSVDEYIAALDGMETRREMYLSLEDAQNLFKYKGITLSLDEMHSMAQDQLSGAVERLEGMKEGLIAKYDGIQEGATVHDIADFLKKEFARTPDELVACAEAEIARATEFAYGPNGIVTSLEELGIPNVAGVVQTPRYLEALVPAAAIAVPATLSDSVATSTYYLSTKQDSAGQIFNSVVSGVIAAHEVIPGHHYQGAVSSVYPSIVLGWSSCNDTLEGWTTYAVEEKMVENGFSPSADPSLQLEEQFIAQYDLLRMGGRVLFTLACLTGDRKYLVNPIAEVPETDDIINASAEMYRDITHFSVGRVKAEIGVFTIDGTYGTLYCIGNHELRRMDEAAQAKLGDDYNQKEFFAAVIGKGNRPLSMIERILKHDEMI